MRERWRVGFVGLLILFLGEAALYLGSLRQAPLDFDVGPSTGAYLPGFTESEERRPVSFRWTKERASVVVPLGGVSEAGTLQLRYARFVQGNASVRLFLDGEPLSSFSARPGRFRTFDLPVSFAARTSLRLDLLVEDPSPEKLGLAVDWIRVEGARFRLPFESLAPRIFLAGVFLLTVALGFSLRIAAAVGAGVALAQAAWFASDPFGMAHAQAQIAIVGLVAAALLSLGFRRSVPLLFLLGYMLKGAALFHPSYFYPDVRLHRRHLEAFEAASGGILERGIAAQKVAQTAYPRIIAGRPYAFPYSPVFYLPFTLLDRDARGIEASMKHVGLVLAALELPLVFLLARALVGAEVATWAALLTVFLPPIDQSTSVRSMADDGRTLLRRSRDPLRRAHGPGGVLSQPDAALLERAASPREFSISRASSISACSRAFLAWFERKRIPSLLPFWGLVVTAAVVLVYLPFTVLFVTEIVPALASGEGGGTENPPAGFAVALLRITYFYGIGFPAMAIAGFLLAWRDGERWASRVLAAYGLSFRWPSGASRGLRNVQGLEGIRLHRTVRRRSPRASLSIRSGGEAASGRFAAVMVAAGLIAFGLAKYVEYFRMHTVLAGIPAFD